ncbi:hypothetical protein ABE096_12440 [Robertmurraya massiliosenegalensis]|uniref:hypothetical protein n=1 Tax=Robertmurraya TaxID=2837507 RepID=UPI0039A744C6
MNFFTEARMMEFWGYVKTILTSASPMVMLMFALIAVGFTIGIIIRIFKEARKDDDEDDYEIKHY